MLAYGEWFKEETKQMSDLTDRIGYIDTPDDCNVEISYTKELDFIQPKKVVDKMISMSVIDDIKAEIDNQYKWLMQTNHTLYDIDIAFNSIKSFIDKHIGGREDKE